MRRWATPLLLATVLAAAPVVADLDVSPSDVFSLVDQTTTAAYDAAQPVVDHAASTVQSTGAQASAQAEATVTHVKHTVYQAPGGGNAPSAPGSPPGQDVQQVLSVAEPARALLRQVVALAPADIVLLVQVLGEQAAHGVAQNLPDLAPKDGASQAEPAAQNAPASAAQSVSGPSLGVASVAAASAAAAVAAVTVFWFIGSSSSLGASSATGAGAKGSSELRRLLPFASPLFTRFEKDTVLGHPRREALYALILQEPGISLQALGDRTGLSRTAVVHHLRLLEQQHLVVSRRVGRSRHYFENGGRYGHDQKEGYAILQNDRSRAVADYIKSNPGTMQKMVCEALGIPPSIAHWHVQRLQQASLVTSIRQGRSVAYFPAPNLTAVAATPVPAAPLALA